MSVGNFGELRRHMNHKIVCVGYAVNLKEIVNVAIELEEE